jgi:fructose-bisphosphate aldolase class I
MVLREVHVQLGRHRVVLDGTLLKPNMVLPGADHRHDVDDQRIADATVAVLRDTVPVAVPGVVFLSGGQSEQQATARLNAINLEAAQPWQLSFSFGRALQAPVLRTWAGDETNRLAAHAALLHRASLNDAARRGSYDGSMEAVETPASECLPS